MRSRRTVAAIQRLGGADAAISLRAERPLDDVNTTFEAVLDGSAPAR